MNCRTWMFAAAVLAFAFTSLGPAFAQAEPLEPTCPIVITQPGSYELQGDLSCPDHATEIRILADDVTLDLNGYTVDGANLEYGGGAIAVGISILGDDVTILGPGTVKGFAFGIQFFEAARGQVAGTAGMTDLIVEGNTLANIRLVHSDDALIQNTLVRFSKQVGVDVFDSSNVQLGDSEVRENGTFGILVRQASHSATFRDSDIVSNLTGIRIQHSDDASIRGSVIDENTFRGVDIANSSGHLIGGVSNEISGNFASGIALTNSSNVQIQGNQLINNNATNDDGDIKLESTSHTTIRGNNVSGDGDGVGIWLDGGSEFNFIVRNTVQNHTLDLRDDNPDCDRNIWRSNTFGTAGPGSCIR